MDSDAGTWLLEEKWEGYLKQRGHRLDQRALRPNAIVSRNAKRKRYRWLLLTGDRRIRRLRGPEATIIRRHLREARCKREECYLVVGFLDEPRRIVVMPAAVALSARRVRSDVGGIAWEE